MESQKSGKPFFAFSLLLLLVIVQRVDDPASFYGLQKFRPEKKTG